jgi:AmmeMemoRadiSam system protein A
MTTKENIPTATVSEEGDLLSGDAGGVLLPENAGSILLPRARAAIAARMGLAAKSPGSAAWLCSKGASFVTLMLNGKLRGRIGTLEAQRALGEDVEINAVAAAFNDPRFKAVNADEFQTMTIEVAVLSALTPLSWRDEADALAQLRPGIDGLIFEYGHHRSAFLPQMWAEFADPAIFIGNLKYKGGLPPDFWDPAVNLLRYTVNTWREADTK